MSNKVSVQVERSSITVANRSNGSDGSSSGSSNSWFIKRNNSSVRVSNELSVQVKGTSIAVGTSISNSLGSKMVSTSSSNSWLINRGHCTIGMGLKTKERSSRGHSNASSKNQKLHVDDVMR